MIRGERRQVREAGIQWLENRTLGCRGRNHHACRKGLRPGYRRLFLCHRQSKTNHNNSAKMDEKARVFQQGHGPFTLAVDILWVYQQKARQLKNCRARLGLPEATSTGRGCPTGFAVDYKQSCCWSCSAQQTEY